MLYISFIILLGKNLEYLLIRPDIDPISAYLNY